MTDEPTLRLLNKVGVIDDRLATMQRKLARLEMLLVTLSRALGVELEDDQPKVKPSGPPWWDAWRWEK